MTDATSDKSVLPTDSAARKEIPLARGVLDYFPAALIEVAKLSQAGNAKHNPGEELHWARGKSMDHADCILRHLAERGTIDSDGLSHTVKVAWRALALLQEECEGRGAPMARGARDSLTDLRIGASSVSGISDKEEFPLGIYGPCKTVGCFDNVGVGEGLYCRAHR